MSFDYQPVLKGELVALRPLRAADCHDLYAVASDPLTWKQHPVADRHEEGAFESFFREALASGGALIAIDVQTRRVIGSSRFHGYDEERSTVLVVAGMSGAAVAHEIDDLWRDPEPQWWHGVQDLVAFGAGIGAALFIWRLGG